MKRARIRYDTSAVSPIISAILLLTIMLVTVGSIMAWAIPRITQMENDAQYDGVYSSFQVFDSRADDVIYGGEGTSRSTGFSVGGGDLLLGRDNGYILYYWSLIEENVTFTSVSGTTGKFSFIFDHIDGDNLSVNITGSVPLGGFTSIAGAEEHSYASDAIMGEVTPGEPFGDVQYVRVHNGTTDLAEAYYFRMKVMEHQFSTANGYYEIKWMNGAIVTNRGSAIGSVSDIPYVYPRGDDLSINMINLTANRTGFGTAGRGTFNINIRNTGSTLLINKQVYSFKMSIHTEYSGGWNIYFNNHRDFDPVKNANYKTFALGYRIGEFTNLKLSRTGLDLTGVTR